MVLLPADCLVGEDFARGDPSVELVEPELEGLVLVEEADDSLLKLNVSKTPDEMKKNTYKTPRVGRICQVHQNRIGYAPNNQHETMNYRCHIKYWLKLHDMMSRLCFIHHR